jgi:hypothetical protein
LIASQIQPLLCVISQFTHHIDHKLDL